MWHGTSAMEAIARCGSRSRPTRWDAWRSTRTGHAWRSALADRVSGPQEQLPADDQGDQGAEDPQKIFQITPGTRVVLARREASPALLGSRNASTVPAIKRNHTTTEAAKACTVPLPRTSCAEADDHQKRDGEGQ
jgi:hypothetical protein